VDGGPDDGSSEGASWLGRPPPVVRDLAISVDGAMAYGLVAYPRGTATRLVVCAHGMGHTVESWRAHLARIADHGAVAVAMDYDPYFDLDRGAAETVAAARFFQERYPTIDTTYLFSVSMGGAVAGLGLAESDGVFDRWFDIEGLTDLFESYAEAKAFGNRAAADMERDSGGDPTTATAEYERRSPALRGDEIVAHGIESVLFVHSVNDGLVPYDQARELAEALRDRGVPWDFYSVLRGPCAEQGTTGTSQMGLFNPACLAGHATESSATHPVMSTAFDVLFASFRGEYTFDGNRELTVDQPD